MCVNAEKGLQEIFEFVDHGSKVSLISSRFKDQKSEVEGREGHIGQISGVELGYLTEQVMKLLKATYVGINKDIQGGDNMDQEGRNRRLRDLNNEGQAIKEFEPTKMRIQGNEKESVGIISALVTKVKRTKNDCD